MCRRHLHLAWVLLVLGSAAAAQAADLAHRWSFNGSLVDSVAGADAVIVDQGNNNATLSDTQVTLAGGGKDTSDYVDLPDGVVSSLGDTVTFECWATQHGTQNWSRIFDFGTSTSENVFMSWTVGGNLNNDRVGWAGSFTEDGTCAPYTLDTEFHIIITFEPGLVSWWVAPVNSPMMSDPNGSRQTNNLISELQDDNNWLGRSQWPDNTANASWNEARLWVGALTEADRAYLHTLGPDGNLNPNIARSPSPSDGADDVIREITLEWAAADVATGHDVYLGTVFEDVNDATRTDPRDVLAEQNLPGVTYTPAQRLELDATYYWRVDTVDAGANISKGSIWSFNTEPVAYTVADVNVAANVPPKGDYVIEHIVDGSGLLEDGGHSTVDVEMWQGQAKPGDVNIVIDFAFDRVYKLDEALVWNYNHGFEYILNFGLKDITVEYSVDGNDWSVLRDEVLAQGASSPATMAQAIDFEGKPARYVRFLVNSNYGGGGVGLSEVQFKYLPVVAREPDPEPGAEGVEPDLVLSWRAGREAALHEVHVGTDPNVVAAGGALADTVAVAAYDTFPLDLMLSQKYYWMITEVNEAEIPTSWDSPLWDFNTPDFKTVDNMESYDDEEGTRIFDFWIDGYGVNSNGSLVGYDFEPFAEETLVHSGAQSMPFRYGENGAAMSEATLTLPAPENWTRAGVNTLVIWFRGQLGNPTGQLYAKINGGAPINYTGSAASLAAPVWKQWNIDLTALGAAASNVTSLTLGLSGSGRGQLYFDDIRLYSDAPPQTGNAVDPGTGDLALHYPMSDNVSDASANGRNGTTFTGASFGNGPSGYGRALVLDGVSGYVEMPIGPLVQASDSMTVAAWVNWDGGDGLGRIFDFGSGETANMWMAPDLYGGLCFAITTSGNTNESRVVAPNQLPTGWHHVAVTIDGATSEMNLYLDGSAVDTETTATLPSALGNTTQNWIARSQYAADAYFGGSEDEFRIYTRALSAAEVQYLAGDR